MSPLDRSQMRVFLAEAIGKGSKEVVGPAARRFGVSRQTVHRYLAEMVSAGILILEFNLGFLR